MLNCSVGISETADMAATSAVRENGKTPVGIESNEEINRPTVDKLCRVARKGHERHPNTTVVIALEGPDPGLKAAPFGPVFRGLKPPAPSGNRDLQL